MENINVLLVFCEGPHDVAFCRLVFEYCFDIVTVKGKKGEGEGWKFSRYPAPFNLLFKINMVNHAAQDMSRDMAHKFFLPDKTLYDENKKLLILLFNTGGKDNTENPRKFLEGFLRLLKKSKIFPDDPDDPIDATTIVNNCNYLFLYDGDNEKPDKVFSDCKKNFSQIGDDIFIGEDFITDDGNNLAASCMERTVGVYVFSKSDSPGTLEDILLPMFESAHSNLASKTKKFIKDAFDWEIEQDNIQDIAKNVKKKKAIITIMGQGKSPGAPMSAIVDHGKLISKTDFTNNNDVKLFVDFVASLAVFN